MKTKFYLILLGLIIQMNVFAQKNNNDSINSIIDVLNKFKIGYEERDTLKVTSWFNDLFYDNVDIIGTFAIEPGKKEWKAGREESIKLFKSDWLNWGDLSIDLKKVNIDYNENLAWVSFPALIKRSPENSRSRTTEESFSNMLKTFEKIINNTEEDFNENLKLHLIAYYANLVMYQYTLGEEYIWPVRISGVLQKKNNTWKFRQIHFSYPNRGFPNVRY